MLKFKPLAREPLFFFHNYLHVSLDVTTNHQQSSLSFPFPNSRHFVPLVSPLFAPASGLGIVLPNWCHPLSLFNLLFCLRTAIAREIKRLPRPNLKQGLMAA